MKAPVPNERQNRLVARKPLPPRDELISLLNYDAETGSLLWLQRPKNDLLGFANADRWNANFAGLEAFTTKDRNGYLTGRINNIKFLAHRVIWKMVTGTEPDYIDHANGDKSDNRITNLRSVEYPENNKNKALPRNNKSGFVGVRPVGQSWQAGIVVGGRPIYLGRHKRLEDAIAARRAAEAAHGFHLNHGSRR